MSEFVNQTIAQHVGREGEALAVRWLKRKGFEILSVNQRLGKWELDIVCRDRLDWVVVEVKTRSSELGPSPEMSINYRKRRNLNKATQQLMQKNTISVRPRLDVVAISMFPNGKQMMYFKGI